MEILRFVERKTYYSYHYSKVYENILKTKLVATINNLFSLFITAYRDSYNTHHVLIRLIEEWRNNFDNSYFIGVVLMDLSKAFNCISHDLVIAKVVAYGFDKNMVRYIYYSRKQSVGVNIVYKSRWLGNNIIIFVIQQIC